MKSFTFIISLLAGVWATDLAQRSSLFEGKSLRILPLGASITNGFHSSTGNGYRDDLRNRLDPADVTFIGTQCSGNMVNGNNEGHSGFTISQMEGVAAPNIANKPNVVLIYVGTNDAVYNEANGAGKRMSALISYLTSNLPGALIVVGTLFTDTDSAVAARINNINSQLNVQDLGNVMVADMSQALTAADLSSDGEHPNDTGYAIMAQIFYNVLAQAESAGRIPDPTGTVSQNWCDGQPQAHAVQQTSAAPVIAQATTPAQIQQTTSSVLTTTQYQATSSASSVATTTTSSSVRSTIQTLSTTVISTTTHYIVTTPYIVPTSSIHNTTSSSFTYHNSTITTTTFTYFATNTTSTRPTTLVVTTSTRNLSGSTGTPTPTTTTSRGSRLMTSFYFGIIVVVLVSIFA